jgi:ribokinase
MEFLWCARTLTMPDIVVVGSLNMDLVARAARIPAVGETILGDQYFAQPGGKGANQAYAAARMGGNTAMIGCVGNDEFGMQMRNNLLSVGCDVTNVQVERGATGVAVIFVSETGQNSIVVVPGANSMLSPEHILQSKVYFSKAKSVLLQLETPIETVICAARTARECGATVILDPAPVPHGELPRELLHSIDILTPNEIEAATLSGRSSTQLDLRQAAEIGMALRDQGVPTVLIKLGGQGCMVISDADPVLLPAIQVQAIDTTAAGDVFNGALAAALSEGKSLRSACELANRAAAISVTRAGAQAAVPDRSEVDAFRAPAMAQAVPS